MKSETPHQGRSQTACENFHQHIARGNFFFAGAASALEQKPGEYGDVVIKGYGFFTKRAAGRGMNNGEIRRNPQDADIEETAHNSPENKGGNKEESHGNILKERMKMKG
jgi:hypothetical protein